MTTITKGIRILDYDIILQLRNTDSNCIVYKAEDPKTKKKYILKLVYKPLLHKDLFNFLKNEYNTHSKTVHENLVPIKKYRFKDQQGFLIYEFCEQGNLEGFLKRRNFQISFPMKVYLIKELLQAYLQITKLNFFGRDLKLHNVMISKNVLKLGDLENLMKSHSSLKKNIFSYMSPEELSQNEKVDPAKKDIWCLGVDIFYILFGKLPFFGESKMKLFLDIQEKIGTRKKAMKFFMEADNERNCKDFYEILEQTLKIEAGERSEIEAILEREVFTNSIVEVPVFDEVSLEEEEKKEEVLDSLFGDDGDDKASIDSYGLSQTLKQLKMSIDNEREIDVKGKSTKSSSTKIMEKKKIEKISEKNNDCCLFGLFAIRKRK